MESHEFRCDYDDGTRRNYVSPVNALASVILDVDIICDVIGVCARIWRLFVPFMNLVES